MTINIGDSIPEFNVNSFSQAHGESQVSSESLLGQVYILAFYPRDNTPGCTKEMCAFRDDYSKFTENNIQVFGVSKDSIKSHTTFTTKFDLGELTLLQDKDFVLATKLGADGENRKKRTTYIIDSKGVVQHIIEGMPDNNNLLELASKLK